MVQGPAERGHRKVWKTLNHQHRSRCTVHLGVVYHLCGKIENGAPKHGRKRTRAGQYLHRKAFAQCEIRKHLSLRLQRWPRMLPGTGKILQLLQP